MMAYPELRHPFEPKPIHPDGAATVLYGGRRIVVEHTGPGAGLAVRPDDLSRINGFELKPEGACLDDLCVPVNDALFIEDADGNRWFDLVAFADLIGQPYVADAQARVWSFGDIPARRDNMLRNAMAPDFEVTDRSGKVIRRADLAGKKALIVTWSSW